MNKIQLLDLKAQHKPISDEIQKAINEVIENTNFVNGSQIKAFEAEFAKQHDCKYCIAVSNGTNALHVAYEAIGLKPGDEVIVPTMTFIATTEPLRQVGALPVFCDIDKESYNIDPLKIEALITSKTKAIVVVHLHGNPAEMDAILTIANKYNLKIIEDCAQAHLAEYKGQKVGTFGEIATFSFYPGKNLGAFGDAGAVITNNESYYLQIKQLINHGRTDKYVHDVEGYNYRMDTIQAAVLNVKLKYLENWTDLRIQKAKLYNSLLKDTDFHLPQIESQNKHVFHVYSILAKNRDLLMTKLLDNNISSGIHYPLPLHQQPAYKHLNYDKLENSESIASMFLSLPIYPELSDEEITRIATVLKSI